MDADARALVGRYDLLQERLNLKVVEYVSSNAGLL